MSETNIVVASFEDGARSTVTARKWQYDRGQILRIEGIELPESYEVHLTNTPRTGKSKTVIATSNEVEIYDEYFDTGLNIYAYIYVHAGLDDGETVYSVTIPISTRAKPSNLEPTPVQEDAIQQAIAALNDGVTRAEQAVQDAADAGAAAAEEVLSDVEADIADLKDDLSNRISEDDYYGIISTTLTENEACKLADGSFITYNSWSRTDYIDLNGAIGWKTSKGTLNSCYYDSNKSFISSIQASGNTEYTIPTNAAYLVCSGANSVITTTDISIEYSGLGKRISICEEELKDINAVVQDIEELTSETPVPEIVPELTIIQNSQVASSTGVISESSTNSRSDYTIIDKAETITLTGATFYNCCFYKSDKTFISGTTSTSGNISVPAGAYYVIFTTSKPTVGNAVLTLHNVGTIITAIYDDINWCKGKKINWIGDSIVDGPDFDEIVVNALEMVKDNEYGINGSTISLNGNGADGRYALCERYDDMTDDADIIIVSCGTNDWMYAWAPIGTINDADDGTSNTTLYGACKALCKGLIDKYPQKVIAFTTPIKRAQAFENGNGGEYTPDGVMTTPFSKNKYGKTLGDYADIIKEVCGYYSIPVLDMYRESLLNPHITSQQNMFDSAKTHPNAAGQKIMAQRVAAWLRSLELSI